MSTAISLKHISKTFRDKGEKPLTVLEHITLNIHEGEIFVFVGQSGCGKSTLLRIMSGLEKAYDGEVAVGEGFEKKDISFVFQQFGLLPWKTVTQNIELGLIARGIPSKERTQKVSRELKLFGLEKFSHAKPKELSGGQRQRVGIARALITDPKIIFMDEPFSELDSFTAEELRKELLTIWAERHPTIVMVTHIIEEALELADRIAVLSPQPGKILSVVDNPLPRPRQLRSSDFYQLEDRLYKLIRP